MSKKLYELISKVFSVSTSEINDKSGPENIKSWDSFNSLVLVEELESEFKIRFTIDEITNISTISDIKRYLKNYGVNLDD